MNKKPIDQFKLEVQERANSYPKNEKLQSAYKAFTKEIVKQKYSYNFFWLGIPIIQAPQDMQAWQEIIWDVKPDLIIETGVAWGGSIIFNASMLALMDICGESSESLVVGIDIDIRKHNREVIDNHPLRKKIELIEGSSVDLDVIERVKFLAKDKERVLVLLDSNHTHEHVLAELNAYAPLVSKGSYCIVSDTGIEDLEEDALFERSWRKGNSPKSAVWEFLKEHNDFQIDKYFESKLILTSSPDGFLKRIS